MKKKRIPLRDITGKCEGRCRDRVLEAEKERQLEINAMGFDYDTPTPTTFWSFDRNEPPGFLGGHV